MNGSKNKLNSKISGQIFIIQHIFATIHESHYTF